MCDTDDITIAVSALGLITCISPAIPYQPSACGTPRSGTPSSLYSMMKADKRKHVIG